MQSECWKTDSVVPSSYYFCMRPKFGSQDPASDGRQSPVIPALGELTFSLGLHRLLHSHAYTCGVVLPLSRGSVGEGRGRLSHDEFPRRQTLETSIKVQVTNSLITGFSCLGRLLLDSLWLWQGALSIQMGKFHLNYAYICIQKLTCMIDIFRETVNDTFSDFSHTYLP